MSESLQLPPSASDALPASYFDLTPDLLAEFPLDELSAALRTQVDAILLDWVNEIRTTVPAASRLPFEQLPDNVHSILNAMADALGSADPQVRQGLLARSPAQGITRFQQHYHTRDLMAEDRLLRRTVIVHVDRALNRRMTLTEQLALAMGLDLMSQQAVVAFVGHQNDQLRSAAEAELRYLSFLSHDMNNNLNGATVWLQVLKTQLQPVPDMAEQVATLDAIQQAILTTIGGMGRLLQAERLRHGGHHSEARPVDLPSLLANQTRQFAEQARRRGLNIVVDALADARLVSDPDLITLVVQNLIGNAAKFASPGALCVRAENVGESGGRAHWAVIVSDEGPGIAPEHVDRIFKAFQRGTMQGATGVGLGLAIASRAAALLGGTLSVESTPGRGSTFKLVVPSN